MKTYSQRTLPIQAGKLDSACPVCKLKYMMKIETGRDWLYFHNEQIICAEAKRESTP